MIQIITKDDLDSKTIQVNNEGKVFAVLPSGDVSESEFNVIDNFNSPEADDEFYVKNTPVYLQHKKTGLIISGVVSKRIQRGEPRNEILTEVRVVRNPSAGGDSFFFYDARCASGVDGQVNSYQRHRIDISPYANALEFNKAKLTMPITTKERFSEVEPYEKILSVTQEYPLPEEPYEETEIPLNIAYRSGEIELNTKLPQYLSRRVTISGELVVEVVADVLETDAQTETVFYTSTYNSKDLYITANSLRGRPTIFREGSEVRNIPKRVRVKSNTLKITSFNGVVTFTS